MFSGVFTSYLADSVNCSTCKFIWGTLPSPGSDCGKHYGIPRVRKRSSTFTLRQQMLNNLCVWCAGQHRDPLVCYKVCLWRLQWNFSFFMCLLACTGERVWHVCRAHLYLMRMRVHVLGNFAQGCSLKQWCLMGQCIPCDDLLLLFMLIHLHRKKL